MLGKLIENARRPETTTRYNELMMVCGTQTKPRNQNRQNCHDPNSIRLVICSRVFAIFVKLQQMLELFCD